MVNQERYNRQAMIPGWDQEKLSQSNVFVIGSGLLADFVLVDLLSLGFGAITRIGQSKFFEFEKINPEVYFEQVDEKITSQQLAGAILGDADAIIDATNDYSSKFFSSKTGEKLKIPYFSGQSYPAGFSMRRLTSQENLLKECPKTEEGQDLISSMLCSAFLADELRKTIMPVDGDSLLESISYHGMAKSGSEKLDKKVLQIGAGAVGTFSALALALSGAEVTIADFDVIEETNLHRQFLFYGSIGCNKAEVLSKRLRKYGLGKVNSLDYKVDENFNPEKFDCIFSCVDNNQARYYMAREAYKKNILLINGGSSISAGSAMPALAGMTACLDCQVGFKLSESISEKAKKRRAGECFQPTYIIPNQIVGALMAGSLFGSLQGAYQKSNFISGDGIYSQPVNKTCFQACKISKEYGK